MWCKASTPVFSPFFMEQIRPEFRRMWRWFKRRIHMLQIPYEHGHTVSTVDFLTPTATVRTILSVTYCITKTQSVCDFK